MPKLLMLHGPQATGKSTFAQDLVSAGWVRINMDSIRAANPGMQETIVRHTAGSMRDMAVAEGKNIVDDNVNFPKSTTHRLREYATAHNYDFEIKLFGANIPLHVAIDRDYLRGVKGEHSVGRSVITQSYMDFGFYCETNHKTIIVDLDGTLANIEHRTHFVAQAPKDWKSFFANIPGDTVHSAVETFIHFYVDAGYVILYVSGRGNEYRRATERWLEKNYLDVHYALFMRPFSNFAPDTEIKHTIYRRYIEPYFDVKLVLDDRPSVIRMWRSLNLTVWDVGNGIEF